MFLTLPRRKVAGLAAASSGLAVVLSGAVAPAAAVAAPAAPAASVSAASSPAPWFVDPRTPAERRAEAAVPKSPRAYNGRVRETRAVYRTRDGALAVPVGYAFGHQLEQGHAVTLDGKALFAGDATELSAAAERKVARLAAALEDASSIRCEGYADYAGRAQRTRVLALVRAAEVCDRLVDDAAGHLAATSVGYAASRPAVIGGTAGDRGLNRRVVVEMTGTREQVRAPGAPVMQGTDSYDREIFYSFTAPADDGGAPITGYEVSTGAGWEPVQSGLVERKAVRCGLGCGDDLLFGRLGHLTPGSTLELRVRAVNAAGAGAPSNALTAPVHGVPTAPTGLTAVGDDGVITTTFGEPEHTYGSPVLSYDISYDAGHTWARADVFGADPMTVVTEGFENGVAYDVRVRAVNQWGHGPAVWSVASVATVPGAPAGVLATVDGDTVTVTFDTPSSDGGSEITGYQVRTDEGLWSDASTTGTDRLTVTLTSQSTGSHTYAVRAVNDRGTGAPASSATVEVVEVVATAAPFFHGGWSNGGGSYDFHWDLGTLGSSDAEGWELSIDDGPWLPVTVTFTDGYDFSGTATDPGCGSTGGNCTTDTTGRIRAVTADGYSQPSESRWLWW